MAGTRMPGPSDRAKPAQKGSIVPIMDVPGVEKASGRYVNRRPWSAGVVSFRPVPKNG